MRFLRALDSVLGWIENIIAGVSLVLACLIAIVSVVLRETTGFVIFWSEEAIIYLIIFSTFFGAVIVLRRNEHVNVDILPVLLRGRAKKVVMLIGLLATIVFALGIGVLAWMLIAEPFSHTTITPALKAPLWVLELSIAVGMTLFFVRAVEMVVRTILTPSSELGRDVLAEEAEAAGLDADLVESGRAALQHPDGGEKR
ncbi:TRAP transporter small permease [Brevibacterium samyangense]|uniref:Tripartite ATP-independent periplasmic transporters DctQ component domain-containing protein n=1 Tax=Brevibacterium samyangense TaxID=366888 RepID=A0ABN2TEK9_9MICO